jgi:hypothetical protein
MHKECRHFDGRFEQLEQLGQTTSFIGTARRIVPIIPVVPWLARRPLGFCHEKCGEEHQDIIDTHPGLSQSFRVSFASIIDVPQRTS